jgi:Sulfotransferase domain
VMIGARAPVLASASRKRARSGIRRLTCSLRALPDFLAIETQKGGTTSLYRDLQAHPDVLLPARKALGRWRPTVGATSPSCMLHPLVGERVRALLADARLIVLPRDRVERAFSHYRHEVRQGRETLSFADAIAAESEQPGAHEGFKHRDVSEFSYVARGPYAQQLQRWFAAFARDRFLILRSENLCERSAEAYRRILDFLELEPAGLLPFEVHNRASRGLWSERCGRR